MIIATLMGGLGNQMFQYATARRLANRHNTQVKMDLSWYTMQRDPSRQYELDHFRLEQTFVPDVERVRFPKTPITKAARIIYAICCRYRKPRPYDLVMEKNASFDPKIRTLPDNIVLIGYWQSYRYFNDIRTILIEDFRLADPLSAEDKRVADKIESAPSVAIHIRRGDYVTKMKTRMFHGCCSPAYYHKAIEYISQRMLKPHFFVFSDDMQWAREHIRTHHNITYVDHNTPNFGWRDLTLMRLCRHNIIANSSFSWWAAWLNTYSEKIVVGPEKYYVSKIQNRYTKDLFPSGWVRL